MAQAVLEMPSAASSSAFYTLPAYPGTGINPAGFNITFPRAGNYYAIQSRSVPYEREENGATVTDARTRWMSPLEADPDTPWMVNWPAVWEYEDDFVNANFMEEDRSEPEVDVASINLIIAVLRYDPVSGLSGNLGGWSFWDRGVANCGRGRGPGRGDFEGEPNNRTCVADMAAVGWNPDTGLPEELEPGDNYFVALVNYTSLELKHPDFINYISVSELFSVKDSAMLDPNRPEWAKGKGSGAWDLA